MSRNIWNTEDEDSAPEEKIPVDEIPDAGDLPVEVEPHLVTDSEYQEILDEIAKLEAEDSLTTISAVILSHLRKARDLARPNG